MFFLFWHTSTRYANCYATRMGVFDDELARRQAIRECEALMAAMRQAQHDYERAREERDREFFEAQQRRDRIRQEEDRIRQESVSSPDGRTPRKEQLMPKQMPLPDNSCGNCL